MNLENEFGGTGLESERYDTIFTLKRYYFVNSKGFVIFKS